MKTIFRFVFLMKIKNENSSRSRFLVNAFHCNVNWWFHDDMRLEIFVQFVFACVLFIFLVRWTLACSNNIVCKTSLHDYCCCRRRRRSKYHTMNFGYTRTENVVKKRHPTRCLQADTLRYMHTHAHNLTNNHSNNRIKKTEKK